VSWVEERFQPELEAFASRHPRTRLSCVVSSSPPGLVIQVFGDLDTDNSQDFQKTIVESFPAAKGMGGLILDLSQLKYISSTGVGALTSLLVSARGLQLAFLIAAIPDRVKSIFDILGFTSFFDFIPGYTAH
jgi:anti-anti-sigma factor